MVEWNAGSTNQSFYAYDSTGERTLQRSITANGTSITVYAFGIEEHVYGGSGTSTSSTYYYSLGGHLIGSTNGSSTQFYLTDALGSLLESFSDIAGTASVLGNQAFGPYGNTQYQSGTLGTAKGFTGQYQDPSGLDYDTARYYDPIVGLFISADSVQSNQDGMNPYAYVGGNPETDTDPTGTFVSSPDGRGYYPAIPKTSFHGSSITYNNGWVLPGYDPLPPYNTGGNSSTTSIKPVPGPTAVVQHYSHIPCHTACQKRQAALQAQENQDTLTELIAIGGIGLDIADTIDGGLEMIENNVEEINTESQEIEEITQEEETLDSLGDLCSFAPQTEVTTKAGEKPIGTVKVGQKVWAYNPDTKKMEWEPVQHVWVNHDSDLVDLTLSWKKLTKKGVEHESEVIHTNKKHPFLTKEAGFVHVANLHVGMHIVRANGEVGEVTRWTAIRGTETMYNLTIQQDHTYTVGYGQWIVHNIDCNDPREVSGYQQIGNLIPSLQGQNPEFLEDGSMPSFNGSHPDIVYKNGIVEISGANSDGTVPKSLQLGSRKMNQLSNFSKYGGNRPVYLLYDGDTSTFSQQQWDFFNKWKIKVIPFSS